MPIFPQIYYIFPNPPNYYENFFSKAYDSFPKIELHLATTTAKFAVVVKFFEYYPS